MEQFFGWLFICLFALVCLLALWRFFAFRATGTPAIIRRLPADEGRRWRHGVIRYRGEVIDFFKLRSVSPSPDISFNRHGFSLKSRRDQTAFEQRFMEPDVRVLVVDTPRGEFEWALDRHSEMALLAWVESAPTQPLKRMDVKTAKKYFKDK